MSTVSAQKSRVIVGDFSLSAKITSVKDGWTTDMLDTTTLADSAKQFTNGKTTATISMDGFHDDLTFADSAAWSSSGEPFSYAPQGFAIGNEVWMNLANQTTFETNATTSDVVGFSLAAQATGPTVFGRSLHDLGAETTNGSAASYDDAIATSAAGGIAHLHVTAFSGLTNAVVTVEDSANNSVFATIGTFTTATGVTAQRLTIAGTVRRYVRATVAVTGTGSVTYAVAFARL